MIEFGVSHNILAAGTDGGPEWIYLLFIIGVSILSWLGNLVKKHREGEAGHKADDITDVEPAEFLDDEEPQPARPVAAPPAAWPKPHSTPPARPAPAARPVSVQPPMAQSIPQMPTTAQQPRHMPPGPAVVLASLKQQLEAKTAPAPRPLVQRPAPVPARIPTPVRKDAFTEQEAVRTGWTEQLAASGFLRNRQALRQAIVMAEILDRPVALRETPPGKWQ